MTNFMKGDMWTSFNDVDLFLITTNAIVRKDGALVMGRGIASQAKRRWPGLDFALGAMLLTWYRGIKYRPFEYYGLMVSRSWPSKKLGCFQVKHHWQDNASLEIINHSVNMLNLWTEEHPGKSVSLNFPGIGNGKLPMEEVLPLIERLSDTVTVWTYK